MPYAQGRTFFDADSHIMELPDFLTQYADPAFRDRIPQIRAVPGELAKKLDELLARKAHAPERVAEMVALGSDLISGPGGRQILLADPAGNLIELFQPADHGA